MICGQLTAAEVAAGAGQLVGDAAPVRPVRELRRGRNHVSWVMTARGGRLLVCKVLVGVGTALGERLAEHHRLCRLGVPVAPLVGFDLACAAVGGRPLVVLEYLPGMDADEAVPGLDTPARERLMGDVGAALARLHGVAVPGFGDPVTGLGTGPATWPEVAAVRVRQAMASAHSGTAAAVRRAGVLVSELASGLSWVRPGVAHLDVFLPNVLVDASGRFRCLLDLEHVRWVDPVADFVKPGMWMLAGRPGWAASFAAGYESVTGWPREWERRISTAYGLELLSGVGYWTQVGAQDMLADYLRRLTAWTDSAGAEHVWSLLGSR